MIRRLILENWRAYEHLKLDFQAGATSASVEVELPSGRILGVTRSYPVKARSSTTPAVLIDGEASPPEALETLLAEEYGAEPSFLARLAMLHSSTVFTETKGLDLREHLCRVFGVDGLVAALDQTKVLAQAARKTVDSARKLAAVPDEELAALAEVEARATELIEAADTERAEAERVLGEARAAGEARLRYDRWKATADRYAAVVAEVATEGTALLGRELSRQDLAADLEATETTTVEALDLVRRRRAEISGRAQAISSGLLNLEDLEQYRRELTVHCCRMLGSIFEADDAVQETMVRAWKGMDRFEGRSSVRSWLYRIASNVCLDMLRGRRRRPQPVALGPADSSEGRVPPTDGDPAEVAAAKETIRLAFVTAFRHLPARQRAVLILSEVLRWQAGEVAELLDTSVASVNSALQRARATLAALTADTPLPSPWHVEAGQQAQLTRYVDTFERLSPRW